MVSNTLTLTPLTTLAKKIVTNRYLYECNPVRLEFAN